MMRGLFVLSLVVAEEVRRSVDAEGEAVAHAAAAVVNREGENPHLAAAMRAFGQASQELGHATEGLDELRAGRRELARVLEGHGHGSVAGLNQPCFSTCPAGSKQDNSLLSGDYCACHGKAKLVDNGEGCKEVGDYWFKISKYEENKGCRCTGAAEAKKCAPDTRVKLHTTGGDAASPLECVEESRVCKVPRGHQCNVKHQFEGATSDCEDGSMCGPISQRCIDVFTMVKEKNLHTLLSNSVNGDYLNMAAIGELIGRLSQISASLHAGVTDEHGAFDEAKWRSFVAASYKKFND